MTSEDYRTAFYAAYATTHTQPRKGVLTPAALAARAPLWRAHLAEFLPTDRRAAILDVGCGDGVLLWWLQSQGYGAAEGVEVSAEQVAIARGLGVRNVHLSALEPFLAQRAGAYDLLVLRNVLEHFRKDEVLAILTSCRRVLRPGGGIWIQVPNGQSPFAGRIRYGDFTHEMAFNESSLAQLLSVLGFESVQSRPARPVFTGRARVVRRVLWRMVEATYRFLVMAEVGQRPRVVAMDIIAHARRD